jgi:hypothetical protein
VVSVADPARSERWTETTNPVIQSVIYRQNPLGSIRSHVSDPSGADP